MLSKQFVAMKHMELNNSLYVVECGIQFLAKKYMHLINLRIISRFFFCSSACLAAPAYCISLTFCCSTCLAILPVIDESCCHLDTLCCFSSSVACFQSTIPLVLRPPLHLEVASPFLTKSTKHANVRIFPLNPRIYFSKTF